MTRGMPMVASLLLLCAWQPARGLPAFPGAEGYGASVTGGRGGTVLHVTSLEDYDAFQGEPVVPGSFRQAMETPGARTIVFDVGGTLELHRSICLNGASYGDVTIAGQTAPGGIHIRGAKLQFEHCDNILIRHISIRGVHNNPPRTDSGEDAINLWHVTGAILDHVSAAAAEDETISGNDAGSVTVQWCALEQAAVQREGGTFHGESGHNLGSLWGYRDTGGLSFHHNILGNMRKRNPEISALDYADIRNNVIYNWSDVATAIYKAGGTTVKSNCVGNTYIEGPDCINRKHLLCFGGTTLANVHFSDNKYVTYTGTTIAGDDTLWNDGLMLIGKQANIVRVLSPITMEPVTTQAVDEAYARVVNGAGAYPFDATRRQLNNQIPARTGRMGLLGPLEQFPSRTDGATGSTQDSDRDGMPDGWETAHGLDPIDPADGNGIVGAVQSPADRHQGYTWLEYYINETADNLVPSPLPTYTISAAAVDTNGQAASGTIVSTTGGWTPEWTAAKGNPMMTAWGGSQVYNAGSTVTMRALASTSLLIIDSNQTPQTVMTTFSHWSGGPAGVDGSTDPVVIFTADANYTIQAVFEDGPAVSIAKVQDAVEDGQVGRFRISRTGTAGDLPIGYAVVGSAVSGTDHTVLSGLVTIPDGSAHVDVDISPIRDTTAESTKYLDVTLTDTSSIDAATSSIRVYIVDDDVPAGQTVYFSKNDETGKTWNHPDGWVQIASPANAYNLVPRGSDNAYVGAVRIDASEPAASVNFLAVGWKDASGNMDAGTLAVNGTDTSHLRLTVATDLRLADGNSAANAGTLIQDNGKITIGDDLVMGYSSAASTYILNGGTLAVSDEFELGNYAGGQNGSTGGNVTFTQNAGIVTIAGDLWANRGYTATRKIEVLGGTFVLGGAVNLGGDVTFEVKGGNVDVADAFNPSQQGSSTNSVINVTGGTLDIGGLLNLASTTDSATLNISGGVVTAGDLSVHNLSNVINLSGGVLRVRQGNYSTTQAHADISEGDIAGTGLIVATVSLAGTSYTQISTQARLPGDVDGDGHCDVADLLYLADSFGAVTGEANYNPACDFDSDDGIDVVDLLILAENFGDH